MEWFRIQETLTLASGSKLRLFQSQTQPAGLPIAQGQAPWRYGISKLEEILGF